MIDRIPWQSAFRVFCDHAGGAGVVRLREALAADSPLLVQGKTSEPELGRADCGATVTGICPVCWLIAYPGLSLWTVARLFAQICWEVDQDLPGGTTAFVNWIDVTPREEMRVALLAECQSLLAERRPTNVPG